MTQIPPPGWSQAYVGQIPYRDLGRDRAGCDCWGLARLVYAEQLGITLPDYVSAYPSADEHAEVARLIDGEVLAEDWIPEATPRPFDLIVFRLGRWGSHIGIAERAGLMLHMEGEDTCKIARLADARWSRRMVSAYRHPLLQGAFE
jgi:cell wall-associated NlpC family hydrolase